MKRKFGLAFILAACCLSAVWSAKASGFTDIEGHWGEASILSVTQQGIFLGETETTFAPDAYLTRAMFVTILKRMDNGMLAGGEAKAPFTDIDPAGYYAEAVQWAYSAGLVTGVTETAFAPNETVTCEQMFAILYRYAEKCGYKTTGRADLTVYSDWGLVADYAFIPVQWAIANDLHHHMYGKIHLITFAEATRAQAAHAIAQFQQNISYIVLPLAG